MALVNPDFAEELKAFGVDTALECFNCGTCAAICPLIFEHFPRRMIRYVQVGAKEKILEQAQELWRCLHCGLCTQTCPRQANPGELILGLRRYVVATPGGRRMYNPRDIIDLIAANVRKTRNPFGVPGSQFNTWWRGGPALPGGRGMRCSSPA